MKCLFEKTEVAGVYHCRVCGWRMKRVSPHPPEKVVRSCDKGSVARPGDALKKLLTDHGYAAKECGCNSTAAKMNRLGVDGCRREIDSLASEIVANASKQGVTITVEMARFAVDEACRRAAVVEVVERANQ